MTITNTKTTDVLILAGGLGTRLRPLIKDIPKVLAPVNDRSFLDILIDNLVAQGFIRIVLCVGYQKEQVKKHFSVRNDCQIFFSEEYTPLGTAGAIKNAEELIKSDTFIVLNGDTFCKVIYENLLIFHSEMSANFTIVLVNSDSNQDYGLIKLNHKDNSITSFQEKQILSTNAYVNTGVYCFSKHIFSKIPSNTKVSIEYDLFPKLIGNSLFGYVIDCDFIDIGTPERYLLSKVFEYNV